MICLLGLLALCHGSDEQDSDGSFDGCFCLEAFKNDDAEELRQVQLPCYCIFHYKCIKEWLLSNDGSDGCPTCQRPFTEDDFSDPWGLVEEEYRQLMEYRRLKDLHSRMKKRTLLSRGLFWLGLDPENPKREHQNLTPDELLKYNAIKLYPRYFSEGEDRLRVLQSMPDQDPSELELNILKFERQEWLGVSRESSEDTQPESDLPDLSESGSQDSSDIPSVPALSESGSQKSEDIPPVPALSEIGGQDIIPSAPALSEIGSQDCTRHQEHPTTARNDYVNGIIPSAPAFPENGSQESEDTHGQSASLKPSERTEPVGAVRMQVVASRLSRRSVSNRTKRQRWADRRLRRETMGQLRKEIRETAERLQDGSETK